MNKLFFPLIFSCFYSLGQKICKNEKITQNQTISICNDNPWELVFQDEFNGDNLNLNVCCNRKI